MNEIVQRVHDASVNREGIFGQTWWWKLPQHNLPNEFEYAKYFKVTDEMPVMKVKKPKPAAMWLMQRVTCESGINSDYLTARFIELWQNKET